MEVEMDMKYQNAQKGGEDGGDGGGNGYEISKCSKRRCCP